MTGGRIAAAAAGPEPGSGAVHPGPADGTTVDMRFRTGLIIGLAVGYYYGTRAGRERYLQIEQWLDRVRSTTTFREARTKLSDGLREGTAVARRLVEDVTAGPATEAAPGGPPPSRHAGDPSLN